MGMPINAEAYREILRGDRDWLLANSPDSLERRHILLVIAGQIEAAEGICKLAAEAHRAARRYWEINRRSETNDR